METCGVTPHCSIGTSMETCGVTPHCSIGTSMEQCGVTPHCSIGASMETCGVIFGFHPLEEAGCFPGMAGRAGRSHENEDRVPVAIHADLVHPLNVARGLALVPQRLPASAPKVRLAGLLSQGQRAGIHPCQHQHRPGPRVLHDGRGQSTIVPFDFHDMPRAGSCFVLDPPSSARPRHPTGLTGTPRSAR